MAISDTKKKDFRDRLSKTLGEAEDQVQGIADTLANRQSNQANANNNLSDNSNRTDPLTGQTLENATPDGTNSPTMYELSNQGGGASVSGEEAAEAGVPADQFSNMLENDTSLTQRERQQIQDDLGVSEAEADAYYIPDKGARDLYENLFEQSDLPETKARMNQVQKQIDEARKDLSESVEQIDENPWLSEDTRVGRGEKRLSQAEDRIFNLQNRYNNLQRTYNRGLEEVENIVGYQDDDIRLRNNVGQQKLDYLTQRAEIRAEQIEQERFSDAVDEEAVPYFRTQQENSEPDLVGSASTGYYQWDPEIQRYTQVIAPTGGGSGDSGTGGGSGGSGTGGGGTQQYNIPTRKEYIRATMGPNQSKEDYAQGHKEYRELYGDGSGQSGKTQTSQNVNPWSEDDLSPTSWRELRQAKIDDQDRSTQNYFLSADNDFQDWFTKAMNGDLIDPATGKKIPALSDALKDGNLTPQQLRKIEQHFIAKKEEEKEEESDSVGTGREA